MALLLVGTLSACGGNAATDSSPDPTPAHSDVSPASSDAGSANGVETRSAKQILKAAQKAAVQADSFHLNGSIPNKQGTVELDMVMTPQGSRGTLTSNEVTSELVVTPAVVYIKGEGAFDKEVLGPEAVDQLAGKYLQIPGTEQSAAPFAAFASGPLFIDQLLSDPKGLAKGEVGEYGGQPAVELTLDGGRVWVATTGDPFPLAMVPDQQVAPTTFSEWNSAGTVEPPPPDVVVSISELIAG